MDKVILVAGATGHLGFKIVKALQNNEAEIRVIVRPESSEQVVKDLKMKDVTLITIQNWDFEELKAACEGVSCVVSALAGLRDVIIDAQKTLLDAAVAAGVPRFIPSDYSLDFTNFKDGENRNLDLRREFHTYLDQQPIVSTSIFNGAFMDLLTGDMPAIIFKKHLVLYWGSEDKKWGFTTMDNTASYTAKVALDEETPRYLRIAGDQVSPKDLQRITTEIYEKKFRLIRTGGQALLGFIIKLTKFFSPGKEDLYPAWQGMQYMHNMIDQRSNIKQLDNQLYPALKWTTVKEFLSSHKQDI